MNSGLGAKQHRAREAAEAAGSVVLTSFELASMRQTLHELANIFTAVMISGGLLAETVREERQRHYAAALCHDGERGRRMVGELRGQLLKANPLAKPKAAEPAKEHSAVAPRQDAADESQDRRRR